MDSRPVTDHTTPSNQAQPAFVEKLRHSKALLPTMAVMGVTLMALTAALAVNHSEARTGAAAPTANAAMAPSQATALLPDTRHAAAAVTPAPRARACANCGTVESMVAVQRQGKVNGVAVGGTTVGLGTVAGGVVGGLLGHQVGGGSGKTAMTVLGAAGGAYAGNTIEKNMKKTTVYQMRVRMDNGTVRTIEQASAVGAGSRVLVEGKALRLAPVNSSSAVPYQG
ncbi:Glycine zipper 2TM domain-containing protein [Polaromonas sp. OV174]|uniref:glycine zipper 2TM domain-containing protein n=1 Tax=Polaromonas sp. OV174 TaxID=1855300 RepID=UPI0008E62F48|nr:glycine zipper 2TM domain-containing protein [Polaromonas sp. OV174]SFC49023.1 Glycine zipper 2TM domain-containing protein [Polaromonas sp. OV174]